MKLLPVIAFAFLAFSLVLNIFIPKSPQAMNLENFKLPNFQATQLNGNGFSSVANPKGIIIYNFFASWCTPCLAEHPYIMRLKNDHNVKIIGVAWKDSKNNVKNWLNKHGNPYSSVIYDNEGDVSVLFGLSGLPQTYVFDTKRRLIFYRKGAITENIYRNGLLPALEL